MGVEICPGSMEGWIIMGKERSVKNERRRKEGRKGRRFRLKRTQGTRGRCCICCVGVDYIKRGGRNIRLCVCVGGCASEMDEER